VFDQTLEAILPADNEGRSIDANAAACALIGYDQDALWRSIVWALTPVLRRKRGQQLWQTFPTTGSRQSAYTLGSKDGSLIEVEYRAVANSVPGLHLAIPRNITERQQTAVLSPRRLTLITPSEFAKSCRRFEVADTPPGTPSVLRPRIFAPFFTTKSQRIVEGHGGTMSVQS
jgi:PAS domain S-box-containing protein